MKKYLFSFLIIAAILISACISNNSAKASNNNSQGQCVFQYSYNMVFYKTIKGHDYLIGCSGNSHSTAVAIHAESCPCKQNNK